jgi:anti-sigma28 factor (negative regulator of flagellin synthesis)
VNIKRTDINAANLKLYENTKKEAAKNFSGKDGASSVKAEHSDKITISQEAKNLNVLDFAKAKVKSDMSRDLAEMGPDRINALKEQIKNGDYNISSGDIVMSIISGGNV